MDRPLVIQIDYSSWRSDTHKWRASIRIEQQQYHAIGVTIDAAINKLRSYLIYLRTRELRHVHFSDALIDFIENKQETTANEQ